jgi:predicted nucleic acid-binding Zn ribbon protein
MVRGEPLTLWFEAIEAMRRAVELWDMIRTPDVEGLQDLVLWADTGAGLHAFIRKGTADSGGFVSSLGFRVEDVGRVEIIDTARLRALVKPARLHLLELMNGPLKQVSPQLLWDGDLGLPTMYIMPFNLLSAMWLQLALALNKKEVDDYKQCEGCGKWISVGLYRTDKRTCSEKCKKKVQRRNKAVT